MEQFKAQLLAFLTKVLGPKYPAFPVKRAARKPAVKKSVSKKVAKK